MFQFGGLATSIRLARLPRAGFPHSDTRGSQAVRASPRLFAACRVLPRLREPRHPPRALRYLSRTGARPSSLSGEGPLELSSLLLVYSVVFQVLLSFLLCLSFHPVKEPSPSGASAPRGRVENKGVEPLTPSLQSWCSSQLS